MKHLSPCPYSGAAHCGDHIGYCNGCQKYGRMTPQDKRVVFFMLFIFIITLLSMLFGCSDHYCPSYSSYHYNKKIVAAKNYKR